MLLPDFCLSFQYMMLLSYYLESAAIALKDKTERAGGVAIGEER